GPLRAERGTAAAGVAGGARRGRRERGEVDAGGPDARDEQRTVALRLEPGEARDELADVVGVLVERAEAGGLPGDRAADGIGQPGHAVARGAHGGAQRLI